MCNDFRHTFEVYSSVESKEEQRSKNWGILNVVYCLKLSLHLFFLLLLDTTLVVREYSLSLCFTKPSLVFLFASQNCLGSMVLHTDTLELKEKSRKVRSVASRKN